MYIKKVILFKDKIVVSSLLTHRNMPDIEPLMQEWPAEFEELLNQVLHYSVTFLNNETEVICEAFSLILTSKYM